MAKLPTPPRTVSIGALRRFDFTSRWDRHYVTQRTSYSARNASTGEMRLVRSAGTREATTADNPSAVTATDVTEGLNGFTP